MDSTYSLTPKLQKTLRKLEKHQPALITEFTTARDIVLEKPQVGKQLKGNLAELRSYDWTYRGVALRICFAYYESDNHLQFIWFGTRENFYAEVARYLSSVKKPQ